MIFPLSTFTTSHHIHPGKGYGKIGIAKSILEQEHDLLDGIKKPFQSREQGPMACSLLHRHARLRKDIHGNPSWLRCST